MVSDDKFFQTEYNFEHSYICDKKAIIMANWYGKRAIRSHLEEPLLIQQGTL